MATSEQLEVGDGLDARLARRLVNDHPVEAARILESLECIQVVEILRTCQPAVAAAVFEALERGHAARCLERWPADQRPRLVEALGAALVARLLRCLSASERQNILAGCPENVAGPIRRLSRYPEGSAGALMDPDPPAAPQDATVEQARALLSRASGRTRGYLYVVTRKDVLAGVVEIDDLLHAAPDSPVGPLAGPAAERIAARADGTAVALHPGWRRRHVLPVVDRDDVLVGAIDHRTLHEADGAMFADGADKPLGLAMSEMYWGLLSGLLEGIVRSVTPKAGPGPEAAP